MFKLINSYIFLQTLAIDIESIVELLKLIHDFLPVGTKIDRLSMYISRRFEWLCVFVAKWLEHSTSVSLWRIVERVQFPCSPGNVGIIIKRTNPIVCSINSNLNFG